MTMNKRMGISHPSSLIPHPSSFIPHLSIPRSFIPYRLSLIAHLLIPHPSSLLALAFLLGMTAATRVSAKDWPQWCGSDGKNMVSEEKGLPESFSPGQKRSDGTIDLATATNVKWGVKLGDAFYSTPSVAGGKVYVGGLDEQQWNLRLLRRRHRQAALAMEGPAPRGAA